MLYKDVVLLKNLSTKKVLLTEEVFGSKERKIASNGRNFLITGGSN